jgi:hypothetical protein
MEGCKRGGEYGVGVERVKDKGGGGREGVLIREGG